MQLQMQPTRIFVVTIFTALLGPLSVFCQRTERNTADEIRNDGLKTLYMFKVEHPHSEILNNTFYTRLPSEVEEEIKKSKWHNYYEPQNQATNYNVREHHELKSTNGIFPYKSTDPISGNSQGNVYDNSFPTFSKKGTIYITGQGQPYNPTSHTATWRPQRPTLEPPVIGKGFKGSLPHSPMIPPHTFYPTEDPSVSWRPERPTAEPPIIGKGTKGSKGSFPHIPIIPPPHTYPTEDPSVSWRPERPIAESPVIGKGTKGSKGSFPPRPITPPHILYPTEDPSVTWKPERPSAEPPVTGKGIKGTSTSNVKGPGEIKGIKIKNDGFYDPIIPKEFLTTLPELASTDFPEHNFPGEPKVVPKTNILDISGKGNEGSKDKNPSFYSTIPTEITDTEHHTEEQHSYTTISDAATEPIHLEIGITERPKIGITIDEHKMAPAISVSVIGPTYQEGVTTARHIPEYETTNEPTSNFHEYTFNTQVPSIKGKGIKGTKGHHSPPFNPTIPPDFYSETKHITTEEPTTYISAETSVNEHTTKSYEEENHVTEYTVSNEYTIKNDEKTIIPAKEYPTDKYDQEQHTIKPIYPGIKTTIGYVTEREPNEYTTSTHEEYPTKKYDEYTSNPHEETDAPATEYPTKKYDEQYTVNVIYPGIQSTPVPEYEVPGAYTSSPHEEIDTPTPQYPTKKYDEYTSRPYEETDTPVSEYPTKKYDEYTKTPYEETDIPISEYPTEKYDEYTSNPHEKTDAPVTEYPTKKYDEQYTVKVTYPGIQSTPIPEHEVPGVYTSSPQEINTPTPEYPTKKYDEYTIRPHDDTETPVNEYTTKKYDEQYTTNPTYPGIHSTTEYVTEYEVHSSPHEETDTPVNEYPTKKYEYTSSPNEEINTPVTEYPTKKYDEQYTIKLIYPGTPSTPGYATDHAIPSEHTSSYHKETHTPENEYPTKKYDEQYTTTPVYPGIQTTTGYDTDHEEPSVHTSSPHEETDTPVSEYPTKKYDEQYTTTPVYPGIQTTTEYDTDHEEPSVHTSSPHEETDTPVSEYPTKKYDEQYTTPVYPNTQSTTEYVTEYEVPTGHKNTYPHEETDTPVNEYPTKKYDEQHTTPVYPSIQTTTGYEHEVPTAHTSSPHEKTDIPVSEYPTQGYGEQRTMKPIYPGIHRNVQVHNKPPYEFNENTGDNNNQQMHIPAINVGILEEIAHKLDQNISQYEKNKPDIHNHHTVPTSQPFYWYSIVHNTPKTVYQPIPINVYQPVQYVPRSRGDQPLPESNFEQKTEDPYSLINLQADIKGHASHAPDRPDIKGHGETTESHHSEPWYYKVTTHHNY